MLPFITSLQSHPGNLGKFSKTRAKTASQKTLWQKEHHICWEYSMVTGTQPTHEPVETVNGNNKNEIKLTIPIIASISTLHGSNHSLLNAFIPFRQLCVTIPAVQKQRSAVCVNNRQNLGKTIKQVQN